MAEQNGPEDSIVKLAVEKKLVSQKQVDQCLELVKKSVKIGLATTVEEVMVKARGPFRRPNPGLAGHVSNGEGGTVFWDLPPSVGLCGEGGMGKVYESPARTPWGRGVAIKVVGTKFTEDKNNTVRFYQEIRALAKLNHPNIVIIFDAGKVNRRHFFAMELLSGLIA